MFGMIYDVRFSINFFNHAQAPAMLQLAENDKWVNATWPIYEGALKANNVDYSAYFYPST